MPLTRKEMEAVFRDGGSVLLPNGVHAKSLDDLPGDDEMAVTDDEKRVAAQNLYNEIIGLAERFDKLRPSDDESQGMVAFLKAGADGDIVHSEALRRVEAADAEIIDKQAARIAELEKELEEATAPKSDTTTTDTAPDPTPTEPAKTKSATK